MVAYKRAAASKQWRSPELYSLRDTPWSAQAPTGNLAAWTRAEETVRTSATRVDEGAPRLTRAARSSLRAAGLDARHVRGWVREWCKRLNQRGFQRLRARSAEGALLREWRRAPGGFGALCGRLNVSAGALARLLSAELLGNEWAQPLLAAAARPAPDPLDEPLLGALRPGERAELTAWAAAAAGDRLWGLSAAAPRAAGQLGEALVVSVVRDWLPDVPCETEQEQKARGEAFDTPDLLLGRRVCVAVSATEQAPVRWIEVKTGWVLPGLSPPAALSGFLDQVGRYAERFGPGLVVCAQGWSPLLAPLLPPGVFCVAPRERCLHFTP